MRAAIRKLGSLGLSTWFLICGCSSQDGGDSTEVSHQRSAAADPSPKSSYLAFGELLSQGSKLAISERARAHDGHRVKLVGYMAELEVAPQGAFYIAPIPVTCDEASDGAADLPLTAVLVKLGDRSPRVIEHVPGPIEVTGMFSVGRVADSSGRNAWFSLTLDAPSHEQLSANSASDKQALALK